VRDVTLTIMAGGRSQRMGQNKSFVSIQGKPMIEHILERLASLQCPTLLITSLFDDYKQYNLPMFADIIPDQGALGGLYTALHVSETPSVLCVACDMPFINIDLLRHMISLRERADVIAAYFDETWQIFPALYNKTALPHFKSALDSQTLRMQKIFQGMAVHTLTQADLAPIDPDLRSFININTPSELEAAQS